MLLDTDDTRKRDPLKSRFRLRYCLSPSTVGWRSRASLRSNLIRIVDSCVALLSPVVVIYTFVAVLFIDVSRAKLLVDYANLAALCLNHVGLHFVLLVG